MEFIGVFCTACFLIYAKMYLIDHDDIYDFKTLPCERDNDPFFKKDKFIERKLFSMI